MGELSAERPEAVVHLDLDGGHTIYRWHGWRVPTGEDRLFLTGLEGALARFGEAGVRATLFVIARDLEDPAKRRLIEAAARAGHEIGSHSLSHRDLLRLDPAEQEEELRASREGLQQAFGVEVRGFRAPGFRLDAAVLGRVEAAGYDYDTSLFPRGAVARRTGLTGIAPHPHRLAGFERLWELPLPHRPGLPLPFHPCYSLVLGRWWFELGLRGVRRRGTPFVMLFHLTDFAEPLASEALPGRKARLFTLSGLDADTKERRCRAMLDKLRGAYTFTTSGALLDAWRGRAEGTTP